MPIWGASRRLPRWRWQSPENTLGAMISSSGGMLVTLATIALLVFLVIPNRYLNSGYWGAALLLYALVEGSSTYHFCGGVSFWGALFGGASLIAYWMFARLKRRLPGAETSENSGAQSGQGE